MAQCDRDWRNYFQGHCLPRTIASRGLELGSNDLRRQRLRKVKPSFEMIEPGKRNDTFVLQATDNDTRRNAKRVSKCLHARLREMCSGDEPFPLKLWDE